MQETQKNRLVYPIPDRFVILLFIGIAIFPIILTAQTNHFSILDTFSLDTHSGEEFADSIYAVRNYLLENNPEEVEQLDSYILELEKYSFKDRSAYAKELIYQAQYYYGNLGDYKKALGSFEKGLSILEKSKEPQINWISWLYKTIGNIYSRIGEYDKSIPFISKAIDYDLQINNNAAAARSYSDLSIALESNGQIEEAINACKKGINTATKTQNKYPDFINRIRIVSLYITIGKLNNAEKELAQCDTDYSKIESTNLDEALELLLEAKAKYYSISGELQKAIDTRTQLYDIYLRVYITTERREFAKLHNEIAKNYIANHSLDSARHHIAKGLQSISISDEIIIPTALIYPENTFKELYITLSDLYFKKYESVHNHSYLDSILMITDIGIYTNELLKAEFISNNSKIKSNWDQKILASKAIKALYIKSLEKPLKTEDLHKVQYYFDKSKATVLVEILHKRNALAILEKVDADRYYSNEAIIHNIRKGLTADDYTSSDTIVNLLEENKKLLSTSIEQKSEFYQGPYIDYHQDTDYLYALDNLDGKLRFLRACKTDELQPAIRNYRNYLLSKGTDSLEYFSQLNYRLLLGHVKELPKYFSVINDELTSLIPIEILKDKNEKYLVENHIVDYRLNRNIFDYKKQKLKKLACAFPNYGEVNSNKVYDRSEIFPLQYAEQEVDNISEIYSESNKTREVTFDNLRAIFRENDIFHYAGHARPEYQDGALIIGSDINLSENVITGGELSSIPSSLSLVVLSACETGLGERASGEGTLSLARSIIAGGTPEVISSLWTVNDQTTSILMSYLHRNLSSGLYSSAALQKAKVDYLKEQQGAYLHPFYWGGFIVTSGTEEIRSDTEWPLITSVLFLIVLSIISIIYKTKQS